MDMHMPFLLMKISEENETTGPGPPTEMLESCPVAALLFECMSSRPVAQFVLLKPKFVSSFACP
jgi:hypothetical protein